MFHVKPYTWIDYNDLILSLFPGDQPSPNPVISLMHR